MRNKESTLPGLSSQTHLEHIHCMHAHVHRAVDLLASFVSMLLVATSVVSHRGFYASRRSHRRDTVKLTVCVSVAAVTAQRLQCDEN